MRGLACVKCAKFFRIKKNGVVLEEGRPLDDKGKQWGPYKMWRVDLWECPGCGMQVTAGAGQNPTAEHYMVERYAEQREKHPPLLTVNDCGGAKP
jgi:hypothetical protein